MRLYIFRWEARFRDVTFEGDNITMMNVIRLNRVRLSLGGMLVANVV